MKNNHKNMPEIADAMDRASALADRIKASMEAFCVDVDDFEITVRSKATGEEFETNDISKPLYSEAAIQVAKILNERGDRILHQVRIAHVRRIIIENLKLQKAIKCLFELPDIKAVIEDATKQAEASGG